MVTQARAPGSLTGQDKPLNASDKSLWNGPVLVSRGENGSVAWSHDVERPEQVGASGAQLATVIAALGKQLARQAKPLEVQLISIQGRSGITLVAPRRDEVMVAHRWERKHGNAAEKAVERWRTQPAAPDTLIPAPLEGQPATRRGVQAALDHAQHQLIWGDVAKAELAMETLVRAQSEESPLSAETVNMQRAISHLRAVLDAVRLVAKDDVTPGLTTLVRLSNDMRCPERVRWLARSWAARAAVHRGDVSSAVSLAQEAREQAKKLDDYATAVSDWVLSEALAVAQKVNEALDLAVHTRERAEKMGASSLLARTLVVEARVLSQRGHLRQAYDLACRACETSPGDADPLLFKVKCALASGQPVDDVAIAAFGAEGRWLSGLAQRLRQTPSLLPEFRSLLELAAVPATGGNLKRIRDFSGTSHLSTEALELLTLRLLRLGRYEAARSTAAEALLLEERGPALRALLESIPTGGDKAESTASPPEVRKPVIPPPPPPRPRKPQASNESAFLGDLGEFKLPDVLELLRAGRRSGRLSCQSGEGVGVLRLRNGNIVRAYWFPGRRAAVTDGDLSSVDAQRPNPSSVEAVEAQATPVVTKLVRWTQGQFHFQPIQNQGDDEPELQTDPRLILLQVFKQLDEGSLSRE